MCTNCGCNSCNECNECSGQYSSNCKPILDVNCLPTLGRTSRHYLYRTPDSKLWYANANCTAWLELTRDEATETNQLNVLLDLTNRVIEVEKAIKALDEKKPSDKEDKPTDKDKTLSEALEALKKELEGKASVTGLEEVNKAVQKLSDALNAKEDKDTIYDDSEIKKALEEVKATVAKLETKEDKDTVFDPTAIETRLTALESKEEIDPVFKEVITGAFEGYHEGTTDFKAFAHSVLSNLNIMVVDALNEITTLKEKNGALETTVETLRVAKESLEARVTYLEEQSRHNNDHL